MGGVSHQDRVWTKEDDTALVFWMTERIPLEEVAAYLDRSVQSCELHYYELLYAERIRRNKLRQRYAKETRDKEPEYVPVPAGVDEDQWWAPEYYLVERGNGK